jgi:hypothetical protein
MEPTDQMGMDPMTAGSEIMDAPPVDDVQNGDDQSTKPIDQVVDDEIRGMILKRKEASRVFFQAKREIWDQCWNHYKQVYDKTNKESWQSTTFIPASPKIAEVIVSNMHSALLAPDQPVEFQARQPQFETPVRDTNDLLSVDMEKSQFKVHATDVLRSIGVIGTGIGKIEYKKEYADVQIKERVKELPFMAAARRMFGFSPAPTETTSIKRMIVKDFAHMKYVDRYDIFPEPGSTEITKDNWIIERGKICNYKLVELKNDPDHPVINVTDQLLMNNPRTLNAGDGDKQDRDIALDEPVKVSAYLDPDQEHELLEYWGPAPKWMIQPELYGDEKHKYEMVYAWFWLIDGQYVVRREVTPWRDAEPPYEKGVYIRVPGQWDGIGPLEIVMGLQIELNERVNCQQDEINLKLSGVTAINKDMIAQGEFGRLKSGPGGLWLFSNTDDVRKAFAQLNFDLNLGDSWRAIQWLLNEIQEVSGAVKAVLGNDGGGGADEAGTFRGQLLNKQVASERFIMYARIMEATALSGMIKKMYQRIYQFKSYEDAAKVLGPVRSKDFEFISPEDLEVMAKVVPTGVTSMENKGVALAQQAEEFKMFSMFPWYKQREAAQKMVIQRGQDPDSVIMSDEEIKIYNETRRQMLEAAGTGGPSPDQGGPEAPPQGQFAGNTPPPTGGGPSPAQPANGPGASSIDLLGRPAS